MSLVDNIKKGLKTKKLSAHAFEKVAGLRPSVVHNILQGRSKNPTLHTLQAISKALDCSVQELCDESNNAQHDAVVWDLALYAKAVSFTLKLFVQHNISLGKQKTMAYIEELYHYSVSAQVNDVDLRFAEWLLSKIKQD